MTTGEFRVEVTATEMFTQTTNTDVSCDSDNCELCASIVVFNIETEPTPPTVTVIGPDNSTITVTQMYFCPDVSMSLKVIALLDLEVVPEARLTVTYIPDDVDHDEEGHEHHVIASDVS